MQMQMQMEMQKQQQQQQARMTTQQPQQHLPSQGLNRGLTQRLNGGWQSENDIHTRRRMIETM